MNLNNSICLFVYHIFWHAITWSICSFTICNPSHIYSFVTINLIFTPQIKCIYVSKSLLNHYSFLFWSQESPLPPHTSLVSIFQQLVSINVTKERQICYLKYCLFNYHTFWPLNLCSKPTTIYNKEK